MPLQLALVIIITYPHAPTYLRYVLMLSHMTKDV